jgi:hypothetical protein
MGKIEKIPVITGKTGITPPAASGRLADHSPLYLIEQP